MRMADFKLYLITHWLNQSWVQYQAFLLQAIRGGVTAVQCRLKNHSTEEIMLFAQQLKALLLPFKIPLIMNDSVDIALAVDADGVHLGQSDGSPELARKRLGPNKVIGWSVETMADVERANQFDSGILDYISASAVFPSMTKQEAHTFWGIKGLRKMVQSTEYPVIAIGGIHCDNIATVMVAGVIGVAVSQAIHCHPAPQYAAAGLIQNIDGSSGKRE